MMLDYNNVYTYARACMRIYAGGGRGGIAVHWRVRIPRDVARD